MSFVSTPPSGVGGEEGSHYEVFIEHKHDFPLKNNNNNNNNNNKNKQRGQAVALLYQQVWTKPPENISREGLPKEFHMLLQRKRFYHSSSMVNEALKRETKNLSERKANFLRRTFQKERSETKENKKR